jgi:hypothetical protein
VDTPGVVRDFAYITDIALFDATFSLNTIYENLRKKYGL